MRDDHRISLLLLTLGVVSIFIYSTVYSPTTYDIRALQERHVGETVIVHGRIHDINVNDDITFMSLTDRSALDIIAFKNISKLNEGMNVTVRGTVDLYHGEMEIVADEIRASTQTTETYK